MPDTTLNTSFVFSHLVNMHIPKKVFEIVAIIVSILLMRKLSQFFCIFSCIIEIFYSEEFSCKMCKKS